MLAQKTEEWDRIIAVNLRGVFLCMKYEIPLMLEQGGGAIVNTSSGAGIKGFKGGAAYVAAKHDVIGLTGEIVSIGVFGRKNREGCGQKVGVTGGETRPLGVTGRSELAWLSSRASFAPEPSNYLNHHVDS